MRHLPAAVRRPVRRNPAAGHQPLGWEYTDLLNPFALRDAIVAQFTPTEEGSPPIVAPPPEPVSVTPAAPASTYRPPTASVAPGSKPPSTFVPSSPTSASTPALQGSVGVPAGDAPKTNYLPVVLIVVGAVVVSGGIYWYRTRAS